jgi:4-hydroxy-3-methylbut-2-enyl diphosphate reductase
MSKFKINIAKDAGYCFGVRDAVRKAYSAAETYGKVYMLGDIVHNERVVAELEEKGIVVVKSLDEIEGEHVLFRAHGTAIEVWEEAKKRSLEIIDATCPLVTEIHDVFRSMEKEGRRTIVIGDRGHDEVTGIASQVKDPIIISSPEEARSLRNMKKAGVVSQSTQTIENVQ